MSEIGSLNIADTMCGTKDGLLDDTKYVGFEFTYPNRACSRTLGFCACAEGASEEIFGDLGRKLRASPKNHPKSEI